MLVAFQVEDWNRDFSLWEALAVFGTEAFAGQGKRTLKWLVEEGVPYIDIFSGIECCSGSLWFKDWEIYMREHTLKLNAALLEPWRKGRKIVAGRSICQAGSIRMESRRTFCGFWEASGKRNQVADGKKIRVEKLWKIN